MDFNRLLSLPIAMVLLVLALIFRVEDQGDFIYLLLYLALSLSLIWYGDWYGSLTGIHFGDVFSPQVTKTSPGSIIRFLGWFLLLLPLLLLADRLIF